MEEKNMSSKGRRSAILQLLKANSNVSVSQLSRQFGVSEVTIRKDLNLLKGRKLLIRTRGGAPMTAPVSFISVTTFTSPTADAAYLPPRAVVTSRRARVELRFETVFPGVCFSTQRLTAITRTAPMSFL